MVEKFVG